MSAYALVDSVAFELAGSTTVNVLTTTLHTPCLKKQED